MGSWIDRRHRVRAKQRCTKAGYYKQGVIRYICLLAEAVKSGSMCAIVADHCLL
jgi:hypothetical protein